MLNKNLIKFIPEDYIEKSSLETEHHGNISIIGNEIKFRDLEFDLRVIVNTVSLIFPKVSNENTVKNFIGNFPYKLKFEDIKSYSFSGCKFNNDVYFNLPDNYALELEYCVFEKKFHINKAIYPQEKMDRTIKINKLLLNNCIFKSNFIFESCIIKEYRIIDTVFEANAKLFDIHFYTMFKDNDEEEAYFTNTIFYKSAIFEKIIFYEFIDFKYTSFKGYTLFRDLIFKKGLNLDYTEIENKINFFNLNGLDTEVSKKTTTQETYRIVKYNFEQIKNYIDANKYYMLEMKKYQDNISNKNIGDKIVFSFNSFISDFGQNWIKALKIYILSGFIFTLCIYCFSSSDISFFTLLTYVYNPLDKCIIQQYSLIGLVYKIFASLVIYHLIISLKRQTKR